MQRRTFLLGAASAATAAFSGSSLAQAADSVVVIGHAGLPRIDVPTVQRLYTGRAIEVAGLLATMVNLRGGHPVRDRFLAAYLQTDEERYRAYWTVRRHVGKGAPPREVDTPAAVLDYVAATPGALGYVSAGDLRAGTNVICRG